MMRAAGIFQLLLWSAFGIAQTPVPPVPAPPRECVSSYTDSVARLYCNDLEKVLEAASRGEALKGAPPSPLNRLASLTGNASLLIEALAPEASVKARAETFIREVTLWEIARLDKQSGSSPSAAASTQAVSKPSASQFLNLAFDSGALTQTANGNTITVLANAEGLVDALTGNDRLCLDCAPLPVLKDVNLTASFDLARQSRTMLSTTGPATTVVTSVPSTIVLPKSATQLSVFTARYDLYNHLNPRSSDFKDNFKKVYKAKAPSAQALGAAMLPKVNAVINDLVGDANYQAAQDAFIKEVFDAQRNGTLTRDFLQGRFRAFFDKSVAILRKDDPTLDQEIVDAMLALTAYTELNRSIVQEARGQPLLTLEYRFNRPANQPDMHYMSLIFGHTFSANRLLTFNGAATIYGTVPAGAKYGRLRDLQISGEYDRPLGDFASHPATLSLAGYGQYQFDPTVLTISPGNVAPGTNITLP